jgi:hypothetical protein
MGRERRGPGGRRRAKEWFRDREGLTRRGYVADGAPGGGCAAVCMKVWDSVGFGKAMCAMQRTGGPTPPGLKNLLKYWSGITCVHRATHYSAQGAMSGMTRFSGSHAWRGAVGLPGADGAHDGAREPHRLPRRRRKMTA